jgi:hypothetical protein
MDLFARPGRPNTPQSDDSSKQHQQEGVPMQQPMQNMTQPMMARKRGFRAQSIVPILLLFAVVALVSLMLVSLLVGDKKMSIDKAVNKDVYQAVFLSDGTGQVYFGKLTSYNREFFRLTDVYYPRVEQKLQPGETDTSKAQTSISLAKLGIAELHCPLDEMFISRDKVSYWENLDDGGQVAEAIKTYKADTSRDTSNDCKNSKAAAEKAQQQSQTNTTNSTNSTTTTTTKP